MVSETPPDFAEEYYFVPDIKKVPGLSGTLKYCFDFSLTQHLIKSQKKAQVPDAVRRLGEIDLLFH